MHCEHSGNFQWSNLNIRKKKKQFSPKHEIHIVLHRRSLVTVGRKNIKQHLGGNGPLVTDYTLHKTLNLRLNHCTLCSGGKQLDELRYFSERERKKHLYWCWTGRPGGHMDPSRCNIWLLVITGEGRQPRLLITACGTGYGRLLGVALLVWAYITAVGDRPHGA